MPPSASDFAPYVSLAKGIYIHKPSDSTSGVVNRMSGPDLILIFGWMGARPAHLQKYTRIYDEMYPSSTKILILFEVDAFLRSEFNNQKKLEPVITVLEAEQARSTRPLRILAHSFSNGGAWQITYLNGALKRHRTLDFTATTSALILDSCPGGASVTGAKEAVRPVVPFAPLRLTVWAMIHLLYWLAAFRGWIKGLFGAPSTQEPPQYKGLPFVVKNMKMQLSSISPLPFINAASPRLYLYSNGDRLIESTEVEDHVHTTRTGLEIAGYNSVDIRAVKFEGSPHVAHARQYPQKYWAEVKEVWERAMAREDQ